MKGPFRKSELLETPPHRAEIGFSSLPCRPLPARGAREIGRPRRLPEAKNCVRILAPGGKE
jgi:hypothetical protein